MRLKEFASLIKAMDSAIVKEGGLQALTVNELKWASFFRGLNPTDMEINDVIAWLQNWLLISREVDEKSYSLLLHCPVLLSCNAPTNLLLLK